MTNIGKLGLGLLAAVLWSLPVAAAEYELDTAKSYVTWVGKKVSGQHDGRVQLSNGSVKMKNDMPTGGEFVLDMNSITCNDLSGKWQKKLVDHLKSDDFFNVSKYPTGKFVINKVGKSGGQVVIEGNLTIKDKSNKVSVPATVKKQGKNYLATAKLKIDRTKWDIRYNSGKFFDVKQLGDKMIYDDIEIGLNLVTKATAKKPSH